MKNKFKFLIILIILITLINIGFAAEISDEIMGFAAEISEEIINKSQV